MTFEILPTTPCNACLADPKRHAVGQDGAMVAVHCLHNHAGGVFRPAIGKWTIVCPVSEAEFADYCARLGALHTQVVAVEDGGKPTTTIN